MLRQVIMETMVLFEDSALSALARSMPERTQAGAQVDTRLVIAAPRNSEFHKVLNAVIPALRGCGGWRGAGARELSGEDIAVLDTSFELRAHRFVDVPDGASVALVLFQSGKTGAAVDNWQQWRRTLSSVPHRPGL